IGAAIDIPVHPRATTQTPKAAPARRGGLDMPTVAAGPCRIRLVNPLHGDAQLRRLLAEIPSELPMRPLTDLLVADMSQAHPRLDVTHIPHRDLAHSLRLTEVHHCARRLMQQIALLAVLFGADLCLTLEQALSPARTRLAAAQFLL